MKLSVKKGDNVLVIAGKDAGKTGEVLEVNKEAGKVVVAGVNIQAHHNKPKSKDDKGGIIKTEGAIDVSNTQVVCPVCKKATRVAHNVVDGKNARICKKCGATLDVAKKTAKSSKKA
ncbi:MAG: 50S ribosomal protein L24 [Clostridiales bacterium]|nr:50S ribosomal protein L24 [Clostridiales bacterium]